MVEMNGKILRDKKLIELKERIRELDSQLGLAVIQVGNDEASKVYVRQKEKLALELGYKIKDDAKNFREEIQPRYVFRLDIKSLLY